MPKSNPVSLLRIDASSRQVGSNSRALADHLIAQLDPETVTRRDLADGIPFVDEEWIGANFTPVTDRSDAHKAALALSDALIAEIEAADTLVLSVPIYNFGIPAALKAWIDMIARARKTFHYTADGPVGLLNGKKAFLVFASGGTQIGSDIDFASGYLRHVLHFVGIDDVTVFAADQLMAHGQDKVEQTKLAIEHKLAA
jgi:FMN-dependent NADH-azoreductase